MTTHVRPQNDEDRLAFLLRCQAESDQDIAAETWLLTGPTRKRLASLTERFSAAMQMMAEQKQQEVGLRLQLDQTIGRLETLIRENWKQIKIQYQYGRADRQIVESYGLDAQARLPKKRSRGAILKQAGQFLTGDAAAQSRGDERFPTAAEIQSLYGQAKNLMDALTDAARRLTEAIDARRVLHPEVNDLCMLVRTELSLALRDRPAPYRRQIMRHYGLRFQGDSGSSAVLPAVNPEPAATSAARLAATEAAGPFSAPQPVEPAYVNGVVA